ncbi:OmpA family protein [Alkalimonas sp. MEB108]|uniref:OmpA family protein n=1 Tax=Alkalimonas cellulosilytica TaxID=3058395 RepID=A0ABU7J3X2_9GAMM|nr:OmpA family protein [Alkalimonas sp. MEB108]MEE2000710.1 OmpA family protein [Alkalimonas sp. MEB108]
MNAHSSVNNPAVEHESNEWLSVSDLMAGLLMVFALLVVATLFQLKQAQEENQNKRIVIIQALQQQFNERGINAEVNPETGDITLLDSVLFDVNRADITPAGVAFLERFVPVYGETLFSDSAISDEITRIIIEGHTSSDGSTEHNMSLSLRRANSVFDFINRLDFEQRDALVNKIQVAGRGYLDANHEISLAGDRKVIFRMQFKSDEAFMMFLEGR